MRLLWNNIDQIKINQYVCLPLKKMWILAFEFQRDVLLPLCKSQKKHFMYRKTKFVSSSWLHFGCNNLQHDSYSSINLGTCSLLSLHLLVHWACGKIVLQWMLMASFELMFSWLWGPCIFWQLEYDLWVTYIFFSFSCQKVTSDPFKFRALDLVEKRRNL